MVVGAYTAGVSKKDDTLSVVRGGETNYASSDWWNTTRSERNNLCFVLFVFFK